MKEFKRMTRIHDKALAMITDLLKKRKISCHLVSQQSVKKGLSGDIIIALGGDGTFFAACHLADEIPVLGVNSMPEHSVGFFCATDVAGLSKTLDLIKTENLRAVYLPTIGGKIDEKDIPFHAVNDILFARHTPAEVARYQISIGTKSELQKSSGVWIATGAGSTGGILSAGGKKTEITAKRLQYRVREPFAHELSGYKILNGFVGDEESIEIIPMRDGAIYIDGPGIVCEVVEGEKLTLKLSNKTVTAFLQSNH
jgi:NAD+ kinase